MGVSIYGAIAVGGFAATILTFVWRIAVITAKIQKNEDTAKAAHARLDRHVEKHETAVDEIRQQISNIAMTQIRIEEKVGFLLEEKAKNIDRQGDRR